jgi:anti-sigma factor RsiW
MSTCPPHANLEAYHDGELVAEARRAIEHHLSHCAACAGELAWLRSVSGALAPRRPAELSGAQLSRLHDAVDAAADAADGPYSHSFRRTAAVLMAIAASIIILSVVWLNELPASRPAPGPLAVAEVPAWERVAVTLRADPLPTHPGGEVYLADANLANWVLRSLSGRPLNESR